MGRLRLNGGAEDARAWPKRGGRVRSLWGAFRPPMDVILGVNERWFLLYEAGVVVSNAIFAQGERFRFLEFF
jgi:hypothetical protein